MSADAETVDTADDYLLIARKYGKDEGRRERRFPDLSALERAIDRWRKDGFTEWWIFAPRVPPKKKSKSIAVAAPTPRRLVRQWKD
jgi:hypothetical protein